MPTGYDLICLDEFHRAGAPEWGVAVDSLLEANPRAKVLGTTATPIRFLDDNRDMADELFDGNIASYMTLKDAWDRNILATPRFVTGLFEFDKVTDEAIERINKSKQIDKEEKRQRLTRINNLRLDWECSQGMPAIIRKHIGKEARRIIVFCGNVEKLNDMEQTIRMWFDKAGIKVASTYKMHAYMPDKELSQAMTGFETDTDEGVKLMLSVNMLNEGVHIPRVNAVILLRTTSSKIIYLQQIGRCLTAEKKDKPIILDMVDNITTTNIVHDIKEGYDWYEHQKLHDDDETVSREPKNFVVYDYTLGIQDAIKKLVPNDHKRVPFKERYEKVLAFCEKYGRLPENGDSKEEVLNWQSLRVWHGDMQEVIDLRNKYGVVKSRDFRYEQLMRFIAEHDRLPKRREEPEEYCNFFTLYNHHKVNPDERMQAILDKYLRKPIIKEELLQRFLQFVSENDRLPSGNADAPREEQTLRRHVRERLMDNPTVQELFERYAKVKVIDFEQRLEQLKAFVSEHDRLPITAEHEEYNVLQRLRRLNKKRNDPTLNAILDKYVVSFSDDDVKQRILDFFAENGRLPIRGKSKKEDALRMQFRRRKERLYNDADIAPLLDTRKKQRPFNESAQMMIDYTNEHGCCPSPTDEKRLYGMWLRVVAKRDDRKACS